MFEQLFQALLLSASLCQYDILKYYTDAVFLRCFFVQLNETYVNSFVRDCEWVSSFPLHVLIWRK